MGENTFFLTELVINQTLLALSLVAFDQISETRKKRSRSDVVWHSRDLRLRLDRDCCLRPSSTQRRLKRGNSSTLATLARF